MSKDFYQTPHGGEHPVFTLYLSTANATLQSDGYTYTWFVDFNTFIPNRHRWNTFRLTHSMYSALADITSSTNTTFEEAGLVQMGGITLANASSGGYTQHINNWQCVTGPRSSSNASASLIAPPRTCMCYNPNPSGGRVQISIALKTFALALTATAIGGSSVAATHILAFSPCSEW